MNTKLLMVASALVLGVAGLSLSFLPHEILAYTSSQANSGIVFPLILQLLGAAYLGFAMLNWMAKANLIGGIYSKPVAIGNLAHFFIGGATLLKAAFNNPELSFLWAIGAVYTLLAILFAKISFTHPIKDTASSST